MIEKLGITPEPWEAVKNSYYWEIRTNVDKRQPSFASVNNNAEHSETATQEEANARLIAQAPAMLGILIGLYYDWKYLGEMDPDFYLKPVIEKATGKTWDEIKEIEWWT